MDTHTPHFNPIRRSFCATAALGIATGFALNGCSPQPPKFESTDITGADYAKDFRLMDHGGNIRSLADFRDKIVVIFFGFTQCPDVCPTSMSTMSGVKELLGDLGNRLQVLFITVDPERDTPRLLSEYMRNFDPTFLALRPEPAQLQGLADSFKVYYRKVPGKTPTSYTMDHSAGKYIFDTTGKVRLFSSYGTEAKVIASDIKKLLAYK
ncbi:SCO family protein [Curvibacter sp. CHRR-16]|uniref:SCO family protein n=1 Tax=Curvibacter sp. CHRR-16 TaxID=2835872 RepID=UPI001BD94E17|nr:SCO family protein [Curvibacter sp. CHRR-16]MBT0571270.1 SCO family protein [Curvibacter sp. CHRR-16]